MNLWDMCSTVKAIPNDIHLEKRCVVKNIEANQSYHKIDENKDGNKSFDQHMANVVPCDDEVYAPKENANHFLSLDLDHGFTWDSKEAIGPRELIPPTGWSVVERDDQ